MEETLYILIRENINHGIRSYQIIDYNTDYDVLNSQREYLINRIFERGDGWLSEFAYDSFGKSSIVRYAMLRDTIRICFSEEKSVGIQFKIINLTH